MVKAKSHENFRLLSGETAVDTGDQAKQCGFTYKKSQEVTKDAWIFHHIDTPAEAL